MKHKFGFIVYPPFENSGFIIQDVVWAKDWNEFWKKIEKRYPNKDIQHDHGVTQKGIVGYRK